MVNTYKVDPEATANLQLSSSTSKPIRILQRTWKIVYAIIVPIVLMPLLFDEDDKASRCAYVLLLMALYWVIEPIHLAATALIPVALFPLLGVLSTSEASTPYMKSSIMMFVGGLLMAIAIESCNLHKRIALKVLLMVGTSFKRIMLGIMLITMFLSMWISNTATTAMMIPIVDAMLEELNKSAQEEFKKNNNKGENQESTESFNKRSAVLRKTLLLSIAYSANIGGTGTITGSGTNLVLEGLYEELYPSSNELTYSKWFIYSVPGMLISIVLAWCLLYFMIARKSVREDKESNDSVRKLMQEKYIELGSLTFQETLVSIHFVVLILLWFFEDPEVFPGWAQLITHDSSIKDATPAILIGIIMFLMPANLEQFYKKEKATKYKALLDWKTVHQKMPWGMIILLGGGFSLAEGTQKSGLTDWLGQQLSTFDNFPPRLAMVLLIIVAAGLTEFASNVATASVILPVVNQLAVSMQVHPLMLMLPVTISVSFAFMFPVATPPNALVFESLGLNTFDMIKPGIGMNILCIGVQLLMINTWGGVVFDFNSRPFDFNASMAAKNISNFKL